MLTSPVGLRSEKGFDGDAQQKLELQTRLLVKEGATQQTRDCLKIIKKKEKKLVAGPRLVPDENTGRLTVDRNITVTLTMREQHNGKLQNLYCWGAYGM
jgi:hypothetical protein